MARVLCNDFEEGIADLGRASMLEPTNMGVRKVRTAGVQIYKLQEVLLTITFDVMVMACSFTLYVQVTSRGVVGSAKHTRRARVVFCGTHFPRVM